MQTLAIWKGAPAYCIWIVKVKTNFVCNEIILKRQLQCSIPKLEDKQEIRYPIM